jgi:hypothetical protein
MTVWTATSGTWQQAPTFIHHAVLRMPRQALNEQQRQRQLRLRSAQPLHLPQMVAQEGAAHQVLHQV